MTEPVWLVRARKYLGVAEVAGRRHNQTIVGFWKSAKLGWIEDDETPWCAGFANAMLEDSGIVGTHAATAKSFLKWGQRLEHPQLGCIVVFHRPPNPGSGHVAFFLGFVDRGGVRYVKVLGGNQGDKVSIALFPASRIAGYRWPAGVPLAVTPNVPTKGDEGEVNPTTASLEVQPVGLLENPKVQAASFAASTFGPLLAYLTDWRVIAVLCVTGVALTVLWHFWSERK